MLARLLGLPRPIGAIFGLMEFEQRHELQCVLVGHLAITRQSTSMARSRRSVMGPSIGGR